jgi:hypothetical protein
MDLDHDAMRRQLRGIDADNREVVPRWYAGLRQMLGGGTSLTTDEKAALLGVPSPGRRQFFEVGGVTILGAAVLAACSSDDADDDGDGSGEPVSDEEVDLGLARTAASLEKLAVDTYTAAAGSGLVTTPAIADAAGLFMAHHQAHLDALNGAIKGAGGREVTEANQAVLDTVVEPAMAALKDEAGVVQLALDLELAATQTYVFAGGALSQPSLRSTIMTIGGIEARHAAFLIAVAQARSPLEVFPDQRGFFPSDDPLPEGAVLSA